MKRFSFSTFQVHDTNREAFELCRDVAELRPMAVNPVILVGPPASGKTHLLYGIVNQVRAGDEKAGLAYVTARKFPREISALVTDPGPVERAETAILLVDQLEDFVDHVEELEAVVRIFLDNRHYVVFATSVNPARLHELTVGLHEILRGARTVTLKPVPAGGLPKEGDDTMAAALGEARETVVRLRAENAELRRQLEDAATDRGEIEDVRRHFESLQAQAERESAAAHRAAELHRAALEELGRDEDRVSALETEMLELRRELDRAIVDKEQLQVLSTETGALRTQISELRAERDALQEKMISHEDDQEELVRALTEVEQLRADRAQAEREAQAMTDRLESILQVFTQVRSDFDAAEIRHREQLARLNARIESSVREGGHPHEDRARLEDRIQQLEEEKKDAAERMAEAIEDAKAKTNALTMERDHLLHRIQELDEERATLATDADRLRQELKVQAEELDALRSEAATQVAAAQAQAGEVERKSSRLRNSLEGARETGRQVAAELAELSRRLLDTSETADELAGRLSHGLADLSSSASLSLDEVARKVRNASFDPSRFVPTPSESEGNGGEPEASGPTLTFEDLANVRAIERDDTEE